MEPITWLVITWATYGAQRTTAAMVKNPPGLHGECSQIPKLITEWQPKASVKCIEGVQGF